jgi:hypothetical protein
MDQDRQSGCFSLAGRQALLPRVGDEPLQECPIQALAVPLPLSGVSPVLPKPRAPRGDAPLHGGDDLRTQAHHGVEHRLIARPVGRGSEAREIYQQCASWGTSMA